MESWKPQTKPALAGMPELIGQIMRAEGEGIAINVDWPEGSNEVRVKVGTVLRGEFKEVGVPPRVRVSEDLSTDAIIDAELGVFPEGGRVFHVFVNGTLVKTGTSK